MPAAPDPASILMRLQELALAAGLLLLAAPVMALIWLAIRLDSGMPVLFTQTREGHNGNLLTIHKFRTLHHDTPADAVTPEGDKHITRTGGFLRRYRLDELPQLFDVVRGDLALVGPRPERAIDLQHVDEVSKRALLQIRPGITGPVQLQFIAEDTVLAQVSDPERVYRELLVPAKVAANLEAFRTPSVWKDLGTLLATLKTLCSPSARQVSQQRLQQLLPHNIP